MVVSDNPRLATALRLPSTGADLIGAAYATAASATAWCPPPPGRYRRSTARDQAAKDSWGCLRWLAPRRASLQTGGLTRVRPAGLRAPARSLASPPPRPHPAFTPNH